ncbi:MarR family transcriptional regulator [Paenibacillus doosanensis]|uniref:HTH-type transcriptional regulator YusO n=1 Tax=Paenibacillus konkukensis TaxID=2020716 RepID=A0ABY4RJC4_9BACL|nr:MULTISPECIES: MarR family transcriptional regulator [Paenibacillus]MCS7462658.1 MarR family transcriptional regulator [Paenibacillus doosanensis]UQZ82521.1 putative HTH-type transcriptional regulator YusO [Paenibacillus konkukensis]
MKDHRDLFELEEVSRQLYRKMSVAWNKFDEKGMTSAQGFVLEKLESEGPLKVSQMAEAMCYTAGAITSLADKLLSAGYVERERDDEDRRVVYLRITEEGRKMLGTIREQRKTNIKTFFGNLSDEDVHHLIRIYKEILAHSEKKA